LHKFFNKKLYQLSLYEDFYLIPQVKVSLPGNQDVVIDHLLFGNKYIYVMKDLYFEGGLLGLPEDQEWSYYEFKHTHHHFRHIHNPFLLHRKRLEKLSIVTGIDTSLFISIILVNNDAIIHRIPTSNRPEFIVHIKHIETFIKAMEQRNVPNFDQDTLAKAVLDIHEMNQANRS
jgi:hypothetical protein